MKNLIILLLLLSLTTIAFSNEIILNKPLGEVGYHVDFYFAKLNYLNDNYFLHFYFLCTSSYGDYKTKIDNIYYDNFKKITILDNFKIGRFYTLHAKEKLSFKIKISPDFKTIYLKGVGENNRNFEITNKFISSLIPYIKKSSEENKSVIKKDNKSPTINIHAPKFNFGKFLTEEYKIKITGSASDNAGIYYITINNIKVPIKSDGSFFKYLKLKIGENPISITAVDINNNKTTQNYTILRREYIEQDADFSDVDFPPNYKKYYKNKIGIVIGIEDYKYAQKSTFSLNDAEIMREYFIKVLGIKPQNIFFKTSEMATKAEIDKAFSISGWLGRRIIPNKSEVFIYYAGHGSLDLKTKEAFLIPYDVDPNYASTGFSLKTMYQNLTKFNAKKTITIIDACFSGQTGRNIEKPVLLSDARGIILKAKSIDRVSGITTFAACRNDEISAGYPKTQHGLFTYYFLKGLLGECDIDDDKKISMSELSAYIKINVEQKAKELGKVQHPVINLVNPNDIICEIK